MKFAIAMILVIVSLVSAEPPRFRTFARQTAPADDAPYAPSGWRPSGEQFNLPQRLQPQQVYAPPPQIYGAPPSPSYGPPPQEYGPPDAEPETTDLPNTTEASTEESTESQSENIQSVLNKKPAKLQSQTSPVFLVVPQREKLVYAVQQNAPLVAVPETKILTSSRLQALPVSAFANTIYTPFSGSYVQIYQ